MITTKSGTATETKYGWPKILGHPYLVSVAVPDFTSKLYFLVSKETEKFANNPKFLEGLF